MINRNQETYIKFFGEWDTELAEKLQNAWFDSIAMDFKIPDWIRYMEGASGKKYRYFINNLISLLDDARYLEIGTWAGSTACSALYGNKVKSLCVDNWSEFGGPKDLFFKNIKKVQEETPTLDFSFIENDFKLINFNDIGKFNVYFYDGSHNEYDQYMALMLAQSALDDTFVFIVDDWNWVGPRNGTWKAINELQLKVLSSIEIRTITDDVFHAPDLNGTNSDWHNGYFISILQKGLK